MKTVGTLLSRGRPIARGVSVHIRGQGNKWHGELEVPREAKIDVGSYELKLRDRQMGKIIVNAVHGQTVFFDGDGELTKQ